MPKNPAWERVRASIKKALPDPGGFRAAAVKAGGPDNLGTVVDRRRTAGEQYDSIAGVPDADLSKIDRYAHGANAAKMIPPGFRLPMMGPVAMTGAAYELSKLAPNVLTQAAGAAGRDDYKHDPTTSAPSMGNVWNLLRGYLEEPLTRD